MLEADVLSLVELILYCERRASRIFVREYVNKEWAAVPLSTLSTERKMFWIMKWAEEGRYPVVLPDEDGVGDVPAE